VRASPDVLDQIELAFDLLDGIHRISCYASARHGMTLRLRSVRAAEDYRH
jgi:hypothetical protein